MTQVPQQFPQIVDRILTAPATIASGGTVSNSVDLGWHTLNGILVPAGMVGTALTFLGSVDNINFVQLNNIDGTAVTAVITSATSMVVLSPLDTSCVRFVQVVSNSTETGGATLTAIGIKISETGHNR
jgi:hypothetical protein